MPIATLKRTSLSSGNLKVPNILQTPSGLILIEIQGTIHIGKKALKATDSLELDIHGDQNTPSHDLIGTLDFSQLEKDGEVILNVDQHQRLRGKIEKLNPPLAIMRTDQAKRKVNHSEHVEIPIVDIVRLKVVFATLPEPIVYK